MRRRTWAWSRTLGAALILTVLVWRLGAGPFLNGLRGLGPGTLLAAAAIGAATTICSAWRWRVVAEALEVGLPFPAAVAAYYRSQFLNCALPGGVLGDVHRGVRHGADVGDLGRGLRAVVWERAAGQLVQAAAAFVVLLALPSPVHAAMPWVVTAGAVAVVTVIIAGRRLLRRGSAGPARALRTATVEIRGAVLRPTTWPPVLLASVLVVVGYVGMFLLAARAAGVHGSSRQLLPLALIVLLGAAIPLNVAGWGPREGVAAWVFAAAGWGAGPGTAIATAYGVMTLVATIPGAVILFADWLRPRKIGLLSEDGEPAEGTGVVLSAAREDGAAHG